MRVNGREMDFHKITVKDLLEHLNLKTNKVVVEVNLKIIPREEYSDFLLNKGDKIEIISLVGGG